MQPFVHSVRILGCHLIHYVTFALVYTQRMPIVSKCYPVKLHDFRLAKNTRYTHWLRMLPIRLSYFRLTPCGLSVDALGQNVTCKVTLLYVNPFRNIALVQNSRIVRSTFISGEFSFVLKVVSLTKLCKHCYGTVYTIRH